MLVTDAALFIHKQQRRDTPQLENVPFLSVDVSYFMVRVRQTDKRDAVFAPIEAVGLGAIRTDADDFRVTRGEGRIIAAQAREMGAAIGSQKTAQKNKDDVFPALVICKAYGFAVEVIKFEIGGNRKNFHFSSNSLTCFQTASNISTVNLPVNVFCWLGW
jgi:hypothetical protein